MGYVGGCHEEIFIELGWVVNPHRRNMLISVLVNQYTPLINKTASEYPTLDHATAKSACMKGFMDAIEKYNHTSGTDFAYIAKLYMKSECQKEYRNDRAIHIPHNVIEKIEKCTRDGLLNKASDELSEEETALLNEVESVIPTMNCAPLDSPIKGFQVGAEASTLADTFSQETFEAPDRGYYLSEVENSLKRLLNQLPSDEQLALIHFNGLFGEEEKTAREVGLIIGMSHQGAINKVNRAKIRLKELLLDTEEDLFDTYSFEGIK